MLQRLGMAALAALFVTAIAHADPLEPIQGKRVDLGTLSGIVYYTVEPAGFCVVATLQVTQTGAPVRFVATLAPEQSVTLSTPRGVGEPAVELTLVRHGDRMFVEGNGQVAEGIRAGTAPTIE